MRGLDPRIHPLRKADGLPGLAASRRPGNDEMAVPGYGFAAKKSRIRLHILSYR